MPLPDRIWGCLPSCEQRRRTSVARKNWRVAVAVANGDPFLFPSSSLPGEGSTAGGPFPRGPDCPRPARTPGTPGENAREKKTECGPAPAVDLVYGVCTEPGAGCVPEWPQGSRVAARFPSGRKGRTSRMTFGADAGTANRPRFLLVIFLRAHQPGPVLGLELEFREITLRCPNATITKYSELSETPMNEKLRGLIASWR